MSYWCQSRCYFVQFVQIILGKKKNVIQVLIAQRKNLPSLQVFISVSFHEKQFAELKCVELKTSVFRNKRAKFCHSSSQWGVTYSLSSTHLLEAIKSWAIQLSIRSLLHHSADWRSTTQLHARSTAGRIPLWDVWKRMAADNHYERPSRAKESEGRSNEGAELFSIRFNTSEGYKESKTTFLQEKPSYKRWKLNHIFLFTFLFALPSCLTQCHDTGCTHTQARFALQVWAQRCY